MRTADERDTPHVCLFQYYFHGDFLLAFHRVRTSDKAVLASKIRVLWRQEHLRKLDLNYFRCVCVLIERTVINSKFCQLLLGDAITSQMIGTCINAWRWEITAKLLKPFNAEWPLCTTLKIKSTYVMH